MTKELGLLNIICVVATIGFLLAIVVTALTAGAILTTDTLFIMTVCLVMAVMFAASPLLYLHAEGKLPIPGLKKPDISPELSTGRTAGQIPSALRPTAPLLDAKGRAVPPDVKAIVAKLSQSEPKDA